MKKGFTLIELLVVVLIIGILSAVALPQYNVAVEKARMVKIMNVVESLAKAQEVYYLANGDYTKDASLLDLSFEGCKEGTKTIYSCQDFTFDIFARSNDSAKTVAAANVAKWQLGAPEPPLTYMVWLTHSEYPNRRVCSALKNNDTAQRVCKALQGKLSVCDVPGDRNCYTLP